MNNRHINTHSHQPNFAAKIMLCDKAKLRLPHNKEYLSEQGLLDFFYKQNKIQ